MGFELTCNRILQFAFPVVVFIHVMLERTFKRPLAGLAHNHRPQDRSIDEASNPYHLVHLPMYGIPTGGSYG